MQHILIVGTGGVGGYFGGKLAQAGHNVTFVARGAHYEAINQNGLMVKSIDGNFNVHPARVVNNITQANAPHLVLVTVKAWQVTEVAQQLKTIITPNTVVIPLQNGVMAADELQHELPHHQVLYGLCRIISLIEQPGVINHMGVEPTILFGEPDNTPTERVMALKTMFEKAGVKALVPKNILADVWKKFIAINVSGLLAVTRTNYGQMRNLPQTRALMVELINEVYQLALAKGVAIEPEFVDKTIAFIDTFPPETTSSLTRDVWEGKPSEIEYQNGCVVKMAEQLGIPVPVNRFVYYSILPTELKSRNLL
jgi:2-dehydropantoate 2-reductase